MGYESEHDWDGTAATPKGGAVGSSALLGEDVISDFRKLEDANEHTLKWYVVAAALGLHQVATALAKNYVKHIINGEITKELRDQRKELVATIKERGGFKSFPPNANCSETTSK